MTGNGKIIDISSAGQFSRVAIVGAATLKGRELADVLTEQKFPALEVKLLDDEESLGQLEAVGDEINFVQAVSREQFTGLDVAFFASDAEFTARSWHYAREAGALVVDLSYALEDEPGAQVRSPWVDEELGTKPGFAADEAIHIVAHPAAITLALLLARLAGPGVEFAVANVFEPASEQGRKGMDELHQQTVNLLSFQPMPKSVFDSQVAFNMLPRFGKESAHNLEATERRILNHYRQITRTPPRGREAVQHSVVAGQSGARINDSGSAAASQAQNSTVVPSLALYQAPIFHSHVVSLFVELSRELTELDIAQALEGEHVMLIGTEDEPPSNVSAAGENKIQLAFHRDAARPKAVWLWAAIDNLKVMALNAVACAQTAIATKPKGRIQ